MFTWQELPRLATLRKAPEPQAVRNIARRALVVTLPRASWKTMWVRLQQYLGKLDQRGATRKVGTGKSDSEDIGRPAPLTVSDREMFGVFRHQTRSTVRAAI